MSANVSNPLSKLSDYDFELPEALIAQHPAAERTASRLLLVNGNSFTDRLFTDLPSLLNPGDLLVMNDTRVLRARFFGQKDTGGQVEVLIERINGGGTELGRIARAQIRASKLKAAREAMTAVLPKLRDSLAVDPDRKTERTRQAITGLVSRGVLGLGEGWIWLT